jgi:hypothetical protein
LIQAGRVPVRTGLADGRTLSWGHAMVPPAGQDR